jgi:cytochrome c oxidase assembly protein Cox11
MPQALMPTKLGEKNLHINFQITQNNNFDISLKKSKIFALTGTKIKNEIYLKNTSSEDHEIILFYDLKGIPQEFIKKLDCPCLLNRIVAAGKEEKISIYFFIKKEFEMKFDKNELKVGIRLK